MSARFSRGLPAQAGTSVLAALVLVALLGGVMVAVESIGPTNPRALTAQASGASEGGVFSNAAPKSCEAAINKALNRLSDPTVTSIARGKSGVLDNCFGAYSKTEKPSNKPADYECTGRSGVATIGSGSITIQSYPYHGAPPGQCLLRICDEKENALECVERGQEKFTGGVSLTPPKSDSSEDLLASLKSADTSGMGADPSLPGNTDDFINDAFQSGISSVDKASLDAQADKLKTEQEKLDEYISSCQTGCSAAEVDALQQQKEKLADAEQKLREQSAALAATEKKELTPEQKEFVKDFCANSPDEPGCNGIPKTAGQTCPTGQVGTPPNCRTSIICTFTGCGGQTPPLAPKEPGSSGGRDISSIFGKLLQGLSKALGGGQGSGSGSGQTNCTSDQNAYNSQLQAYNSQLQAYNQQLQQYNYQTQVAQLQGYPPPPQPTAPTQPCYKPATPTTPTNPAAGGAPSAQISCQPKVADVGMTVAVSYSCGNSTSSAGSGFDTGGATSGSANVTIDNPPAGATAVTYGVQCRGASAASAQCTVEISRPSIILVANPKIVQPNASTTIGWLTTGMKSCVISSDDLPEFTAQHALNTSVNGTAITPAIPHATAFNLDCTTLGGGTREATVVVRVVGEPDFDTDGASSNITVTSTADGQSIARGATTTISWQVGTAPSGGKVSLWLYDVRLDALTTYITDGLPTTGTYVWKLPTSADTCDDTANTVCYTDLIPGRSYGIEAALYTETSDPNNPNYLDYNFTPDTFTISS